MYTRKLKVIALTTVIFFTWTLGGMAQFAFAAKTAAPVNHAKKHQKKTGKSPEERLEAAVGEISSVISDQKKSRKDKHLELMKKKKDVDALDSEIRAGFSETEQHLKKAGLSKVIMERHENFVKEYDDYQKVIQYDLASQGEEPGFIGKMIKKFTTDRNVEKIRERINARKARSLHKPKTFDPKNLPFSNRKLKPVMPRMTKEAFKKDLVQSAPKTKDDNKHLTLMNSVMDTLLPNAYAASPPPVPEDLAETPDVKLTPDIIAKAAELGHDPVKIYNFVRNTIEFVPTWGSIQGAQYCLETKQGNAFDTASLLIALLRASNIHARYVMGTIDVPIDQVMNWVGGFTDPQAALDFIASGGVPVKAMLDNPSSGINSSQIGSINGVGGTTTPSTTPASGQIKYARMEHVWVEALIDYKPSRGAKHVQGKGDTWVKMDGSFKQYNHKKGIDIVTAVPFDVKSFLYQAFSSATINENNITGFNSTKIKTYLDNYTDQVSNYLNSQFPNIKIGDLIGTSTIIKKENLYLIGTLPYKIFVMNSGFSNIPDQYRHKLSFELKKDDYDTAPLQKAFSLPELAGKKITLSYSPASSDDETILKSYLPEPHQDGTPIQLNELPSSLPAYLVNMKPELLVDGQVIATGSVVGLGATEIFTMAFYSPSSTDDSIINEIEAGTYQAIGLNLGAISLKQIDNILIKLNSIKEKFESNDVATIKKDDIIGELYQTSAILYHASIASLNGITKRIFGVASAILPSETTFGMAVQVKQSFGIPQSISPKGLNMDADRLMNIVQALDGNMDKGRLFMQVSGAISSIYEHSIPEKLFSTDSNHVEGISAVKAIQIANDQNISVFSITKDNIDSILPQLEVGPNVISDVKDAVNSGKVVIVPKSNINFHGWTGCGYIIMDPSTGSGAYMLSNGDNGCLLLMWYAELAAFSSGVILAAVATGGAALILFAVLGCAALVFSFWHNAQKIKNTTPKYDDDTATIRISLAIFYSFIGMLLTNALSAAASLPKILSDIMAEIALPFSAEQAYLAVTRLLISAVSYFLI